MKAAPGKPNIVEDVQVIESCLTFIQDVMMRMSRVSSLRHSD